MTEAEWLACTDPRRMLVFLQGRVSGRKLRLFACAVARLLAPLSDPDEGAERAAAVDAAERFADGRAGPEQMAGSLASSSGEGFWAVAHPDPAVAAELAAREDQLAGRRAEVAALARDIFGNPFRPLAADPAWRDPSVVRLARAAYGEPDPRAGTLDPGRLAVLADALEEAGCTDSAVLEHLRGPGPHVRGCWVLDLLLGKE